MRSQEERIVRVIAEQLGVDESEVTQEKLLAAVLGGDSLDDIQIVMALEDEFEIEIGDAEAEDCKTVRDVLSLVRRLVPA